MEKGLDEMWKVAGVKSSPGYPNPGTTDISDLISYCWDCPVHFLQMFSRVPGVHALDVSSTHYHENKNVPRPFHMSPGGQNKN